MIRESTIRDRMRKLIAGPLKATATLFTVIVVEAYAKRHGADDRANLHAIAEELLTEMFGSIRHVRRASAGGGETPAAR